MPEQKTFVGAGQRLKAHAAIPPGASAGQFQRMAGDVAAGIALRRLGPFEQPFRNQRVERTRQRPAERGIRIGFYWKRRRSGGSGFSAGEGAIQQAVRVVERRTKVCPPGRSFPCGGNAPQHAAWLTCPRPSELPNRGSVVPVGTDEEYGFEQVALRLLDGQRGEIPVIQ